MTAFAESQNSLLFIINALYFSTPQNYKIIQYEKRARTAIGQRPFGDCRDAARRVSISRRWPTRGPDHRNRCRKPNRHHRRSTSSSSPGDPSGQRVALPKILIKNQELVIEIKHLMQLCFRNLILDCEHNEQVNHNIPVQSDHSHRMKYDHLLPLQHVLYSSKFLY